MAADEAKEDDYPVSTETIPATAKEGSLWQQPPTEDEPADAEKVLDTDLYSYKLYYVDGTTSTIINCKSGPCKLREELRNGGGYLVGENLLINAAHVMRWHLTETYREKKEL